MQKKITFFCLSCTRKKNSREKRRSNIKGCICFAFSPDAATGKFNRRRLTRGLSKTCQSTSLLCKKQKMPWQKIKDLRERGEGYQKHAEARHCHVSPKGVFSSPEFCAHTLTHTHTHTHTHTLHIYTHIAYTSHPPTHHPHTNPHPLTSAKVSNGKNGQDAINTGTTKANHSHKPPTQQRLPQKKKSHSEKSALQ
jgi:hypothetical protein